MTNTAEKQLQVYNPLADLPDRLKKAEELFGGLVVSLKLPWDFPQILQDEVDGFHLHERCLKIVHTCDVFAEIGDRRRHGKLIDKGSVIYFPEPIERLKLPSKLGTHLWQIFNKNLKPDKEFIKDLETTLRFTLKKLNVVKRYIEAFVLNETLYNFTWISKLAREETFKTIANVMEDQPYLTTVNLENALLTCQDGVRFLYIFGFQAGKYIEHLNLCYFFKYGSHPIKDPHNVCCIYDPFEFKGVDADVPFDEELDYYWNQLIVKKVDYIIAPKELSKIYKISLNFLFSLTSLHVQYSYLCERQGKPLCQIGSILNGKLKTLHILCTKEDLPETTKQVISTNAWKITLDFCPDLKVYFIINNIPHYDSIKQVLLPVIPMVAFYMDSGLGTIHQDNSNKWYLGCTIRMLAANFYRPLRILNLHIWHCNQKVDVVICKCITELFYLEEFEYRGPFDKLDTVKELCSFITSHQLRLRLFHVYVLEDPCYPELYQEAIGAVYEEYKGKFIARDMSFIMTTSVI